MIWVALVALIVVFASRKYLDRLEQQSDAGNQTQSRDH
jgi:hypothetical protein